MSTPILVAVAWPYASGPRHLGHLAGAYLPADVFARYQRLAGNDVLMVSGSDVHGTPITVRADEEGVTAQDIVDRYHGEFLRQWDELGISWDLYTTTGTDNHARVTQEMFLEQLGEATSTGASRTSSSTPRSSASSPTATSRGPARTAATATPAATSATTAAARSTPPT